ncbi:hypothetical protein PVK06_010144 [Gossypium arboreum]|uniref:Ubiquitin-like protease family profile domain-containing protein n=1 Tax=Gossypium arboreum TaxID=29729 RepID=A0ABR0QPU0_GOSAR|nr:hypothetical protein PVK06_010144 [Gossypium arboreum]
MASSISDTALRLLLSCAKAIEDGDLKSADALLHIILVLADERPYLYESRLVKYFADALVRRAYGLHPASSYNTFPGNPAPYYHYNGYRINDIIKKVIDDALMGNRRLHLIDFSIPYENFEGSVLRTLPTFSGDPLPVRVSYILPPFLKKYVESFSQMEFLTKDAMNLNVKLEAELKVVYANSLAEVDEYKLDFKRRREDEMVVVYYKFKLDKLLTDGKAMERELVRLKEINPTIVIMLDFYSNHTHSNFLTCLEHSFQYYSNTCTFWCRYGIFLYSKYDWECNRDASEGNNIIRRHQTLSEWQRLFSIAGFTRIPLSHEKDDLIDFFFFDDSSFLEIMREEEECLILGYKECPMFFLSAWKPKVEDGHFNSISTNHQFGQGFNPNPLPLQPLQPFLEDKRKRKMEENGTSTVKVFKNRNHEKASSNGDIASDFNKNEPNHGRNIAASIEIPNDEPSFNSNQLDEFQSSSSESDDETTLREQGSWCREVVNAFFKLLKGRSDKYPNVYIKNYSFDPQIATCLIKGSKLEDEVLGWFKAEKLRGVHKLFLPMCLSAHWVLFCVDTREKKISWLDPIPSSRIKSNNVEKQIILQWFTSYLLPEFGYNDADEWPFVVRTDIPKQEK